MGIIISLLLFFLCIMHMVWFFYEIHCVKVGRITMKNEIDKVLEQFKIKLAKISIMLSITIFIFGLIMLCLVVYLFVAYSDFF